MAQTPVRICFSTKNFISGQSIRFIVYDKNGNLIYNALGNEWGSNTGIYYVEGNLSFTKNGNESYLVIAEEVNGSWKAYKSITKNSEFILN